MAYTSLYRKFRPQGFDAMIGQQHIRQTLKNAIKTKTIAHAYLFTGTRGTGKTSTAKIFAKAINCLNPKEDGSPCNECECCKALSSTYNLDIIELDAASNNSVEDIREIVEKVKYSPSVGKYKVYIVDEVHMLSKQAFNAFLKTLEEPPEHVVFILATTEVQKIPATILSRCIRFDFRLIPKDELVAHISKIFKQLNLDFDKDAVSAIAEAGNGSVRDALSIADMVISYCGDNKIEYSDVLEVLGASSPEYIADLCDYIVSNNIEKALSLSNQLINLGKSVNVLADDIAKMFNNILYTKNCRDANTVLDLPISVFTKIKDTALYATNYKLYRAVEIFADLQNSLRYASSAKTIFEMSIAKACDITASIDENSILDRIKELEAFRRSAQGSSLMEGTTLTGPKIWGHLLDTLNNPRTIAEYSIASRVKKDSVELLNKELCLKINSKAEYDEIIKYMDLFEKCIKKDYLEITKVKCELVIDPKQKSLDKLDGLFGEGLTKK